MTYNLLLAPYKYALDTHSGSEAAVHAMKQVFENPETEAVLLVDATNAFTL